MRTRTAAALAVLIVATACSTEMPAANDAAVTPDAFAAPVDAFVPATEASLAECSDGFDNDADGLVDCADVACTVYAFCVTAPDAGHDATVGIDASPDAGMRDAGTTDAGRSDAGADAGPISPCGTVPTTGNCASVTTVQYCVIPTDSEAPYVLPLDCGSDSHCDASGAFATCAPNAICREADAQCLSATTIRTCVGGAWATSTCPRTCVSTALGDQCGLNIPTRMTTGVVRYETRGPNATFTDWTATPVQAVGQDFIVGSYRCPGGTGCQLIDAVVATDGIEPTGGRFSLLVPTVPTADDYIWIPAAGLASDNVSLGFMVANPGYVPSATAHVELTEVPTSPTLWQWFFPLTGRIDGDPVLITETMGSGAARLLDFTRYVYRSADSYYHPSTPPSVVVWLGGPDVTWECGACTAPAPTSLFGQPFRQQVWIPDDSNTGFYSDAVTAHELGHYVMATYGRSPGEGGEHIVGVPTNPGMAWSEGWATFFSSDMRGSDYYYDKQHGGFFWLNVRARMYSGGTVWHRPSASLPLTQPHDENDVASLMLALRGAVSRDSVWSTLASPHLTGGGPFGRGYTRRTWLDANHPEMFMDTHQNSLFLADFLDALVCAGGATAPQVDAVTVPATFYPYPSGSPTCP